MKKIAVIADSNTLDVDCVEKVKSLLADSNVEAVLIFLFNDEANNEGNKMLMKVREVLHSKAIIDSKAISISLRIEEVIIKSPNKLPYYLENNKFTTIVDCQRIPLSNNYCSDRVKVVFLK
ncbi:MAG: hypothetical protein HOM41_02775 [Flavobacteriales bacterium]|jgi:hypothetical protein|nr:hypothetical protein [Flavobacteriales bacterium]MBT6174486.1 hypothetical protein [Flavobacteriales bacterium]MBT7652175.1 hypothetical protein [Flavobacteriales bacterium]